MVTRDVVRVSELERLQLELTFARARVGGSGAPPAAVLPVKPPLSAKFDQRIEGANIN